MKYLVEKKITIILFIAAIILVSVVAVFYFNTQKVKLTSDQVAHSQDVLRKSDNVMLDVINIESGLRGYILSENEIFLEPYRNSLNTIDGNLADLSHLCAGNSAQRLRVDFLKKAVGRRLVFTREVNEALAKEKYNNLGKIETIEIGKTLTDTIRSIITAINTEEFKVLKQTRLENEKSSDYSQLILLLLLIFIMVIFVLVYIIIQNQRQRNKELEAHTASQQLLSNYSLSLLEASLDPLVTINTDGKITGMNEATANITGLTRAELTGTDFFTYFTEPQKAREVYQEVFAKGSVADKPLTLRHLDGKLTEVSFNGSVYKDATGNVLGVVIVARDIAEQKLAMELRNANKELAFQNEEKEKRANELIIANKELAFQNEEKEKRADELSIANKELAFQNEEKEKRADELIIANKELAFQNEEKGKRADELSIANKELAFQNEEKEKRADELIIANKELAFQNEEKEKRADELIIANKELAFQNEEKEKRAEELSIANKELAFQNEEKEKRADELSIANKELAFQNEEKENRASELGIANQELAFQNGEKEKRAAELVIANTELAFQNEVKEKRAAELVIANHELAFQNEEKERRAAELVIANKELLFQIDEKAKRAAELIIADKELLYQIKEKEKQ